LKLLDLYEALLGKGELKTLIPFFVR
jgi:hypothetical protein